MVDFVRSGGSKAEAARRFKMGEASVYRWLKPGGLTHKCPGPKTAHKLEWEAWRRHVTVHADVTQAEAARHFGVSRHCIWNALHKMEWTRKKTTGDKERSPLQRRKFLRFRCGTYVAACSSFMSMSAASHLPSRAPMGMPPRDSA